MKRSARSDPTKVSYFHSRGNSTEQRASSSPPYCKSSFTSCRYSSYIYNHLRVLSMMANVPGVPGIRYYLFPFGGIIAACPYMVVFRQKYALCTSNTNFNTRRPISSLKRCANTFALRLTLSWVGREACHVHALTNRMLLPSCVAPPQIGMPAKRVQRFSAFPGPIQSPGSCTGHSDRELVIRAARCIARESIPRNRPLPTYVKVYIGAAMKLPFDSLLWRSINQ